MATDPPKIPHALEDPEDSTSGSTIPDPLSTEEHGRLFSAYRDNYLLPNDGEEQDRLDLQHTAWKHILKGRLYMAPIVDPVNAFDIGTGTGIWAIEFARKHPNTNIIGTDISLIQPSENIPPNVKFEREDSEQEWIFDRLFDFIHWRLMVSCFTDFEAMIRKCFHHLKPGGWSEFHEGTFELVPADDAAAEVLKGSALEQAFKAGPAAGAAIGRDFDAPKKFKKWMLEAGFVDVVEEQRLIPINSWPVSREDKLIGSWQCLNFLKLSGGLGKMLQASGFPSEDLPEFQERFRHDVTWAQMRVYFPVFIVYGRKPF